ncbi:CPCC family cysteine-rich protein [Ralstonia pseudosolanacearum]|uniref:CPCC family cysteine-rich protein n=1 Tax=Ralstonia pseudosolanacearum TaxID=1310165 RepID=UPI0033924304
MVSAIADVILERVGTGNEFFVKCTFYVPLLRREDSLSELGVCEICPICLWEDDPTQSAEPEHEGGANGRSLIEARRQWLIQKQTR